MLKNSNTGVRGTKIDSNGWSFRHFHRQAKRKITKSAVYRLRWFQHKLWNTMSFEMYKVTWSIFRPFAPVPLSPVRASDLAGEPRSSKIFAKFHKLLCRIILWGLWDCFDKYDPLPQLPHATVPKPSRLARSRGRSKQLKEQNWKNKMALRFTNTQGRSKKNEWRTAGYSDQPCLLAIRFIRGRRWSPV